MADVLLGLDGHCAASIVKNFEGWPFWHRHRFITATDFRQQTLRAEGVIHLDLNQGGPTRSTFFFVVASAPPAVAYYHLSYICSYSLLEIFHMENSAVKTMQRLCTLAAKD